MNQNTDKNLLSEFQKSTYEEWKAEAIKLLKGAPFDKKILTPTHENITLQGIYNAEDIANLTHLNEKPGFAGFSRSKNASGYTNNAWHIAQETLYGTPEEFNAVAKRNLMKGQNALTLTLDSASAFGLDADTACVGEVGIAGINISTVSDLEILFKDIHLDCIPLYVKAGVSAFTFAALLLSYCEKIKLDPKKLTGSIEIDPISLLLKYQNKTISPECIHDEMFLLLKEVAQKIPNMKFLGVSTQPIRDSGGNAVQGLGFALATSVTYINEMQKKGLSAKEVVNKFRFSFSIGGNFFMEIASLRAARLLWSRILEAYGVNTNETGMTIHAQTGSWNKTMVDSQTNILRASSEAFSAVLGGCQSLHISPYDEIYAAPNDFTERIARNMQIILKEECHLTHVIDPAGGSWYVEWLTDAIANKAWAFFQEIEANGSLMGVLKSGWLEKQISSVANQKITAIEKRSEVMVGVNNYPNPHEKLPQVNLTNEFSVYKKRVSNITSHRTSGKDHDDHSILEALNQLSNAQELKLNHAMNAAKHGASIGEITRALRQQKKSEISIQALKTTRASANYEKIRATCEKMAHEGKPALIFQANIGSSRIYRARADWTTAYFSVGGFNIKSNIDYESIESATEAFAQSSAQVIIICSSDDKYTEILPAFAQLLKQKKPNGFILLAGAPGENEQNWRDAGINDFVHVRTNNYAMLKNILSKMGMDL